MAVQNQVVANRYQLLERLGAGGMGEVWKARDRKFESRSVALKLLKEDETLRQDAENRARLIQLLQEEGGAAGVLLASGVRLLDEVLRSARGLEKIRQKAAERADAASRLSRDAAIAIFDELVDDPACSDNAKVRAKLRRLFRDEANSIATLSHPNIVNVSDYGDEGGVPFLAMDYVEGVTLQRIIQRGERVGRARQLRLMEELCSGLAYAHKHNIVHRDIKPANLILEAAFDRLKIVDFGVVRRLQHSSESTIGLPIGTFCYMSPEQVVGSASVDQRSDIFSAGLVLYEFLSGQKAFPPSDDTGDLIRRIQHESPVPLRSLVTDVQPEIESILVRALEKDPARRYQDIAVMQRDLNRLRTKLEREDDTGKPRPTGGLDKTIVQNGRHEPEMPALLADAARTPQPKAPPPPVRAEAEGVEQRARRTIAAAKSQFVAGQCRAAIATLAEFRPTHPAVTAALNDLQRDFAQIEQQAREQRKRQQLEAAAAEQQRIERQRRLADPLGAPFIAEPLPHRQPSVAPAARRRYGWIMAVAVLVVLASAAGVLWWRGVLVAPFAGFRMRLQQATPPATAGAAQTQVPAPKTVGSPPPANLSTPAAGAASPVTPIAPQPSPATPREPPPRADETRTRDEIRRVLDQYVQSSTPSNYATTLSNVMIEINDDTAVANYDEEIRSLGKARGAVPITRSTRVTLKRSNGVWTVSGVTPR